MHSLYNKTLTNTKTHLNIEKSNIANDVEISRNKLKFDDSPMKIIKDNEIRSDRRSLPRLCLVGDAKMAITCLGNRVFSYSASTKIGSIPGKPNKVNQDSYITLINPMSIDNSYFFGIMDGHGFYGREVSSQIKNRLIENFCLLKNSIKKSNAGINFDKEFLTDANFRHNFIQNVYKETNAELKYSNFDPSYSGTTSITIFIHENLLVCANVGDSRAIIGCKYQENDIDWKIQQISLDHKPDVPEERERIIKSGGRILVNNGKIT